MKTTNRWNRYGKRYIFLYPNTHRQNLQFVDRADYAITTNLFEFYARIHTTFAPNASKLQKDGTAYLRANVKPKKHLFVCEGAKKDLKGRGWSTNVQYYALCDEMPNEEFVRGLKAAIANMAEESPEIEHNKVLPQDNNPWATGSRC